MSEIQKEIQKEIQNEVPKNTLLDATKITLTSELLEQRIAERFPDSGLLQVVKTISAISKQSEKEAMTAWKKDNPESSLKVQRRLLEQGVIDHLPWDDYLKAKADFTDDEAAEEAAKWAMEQLELKKKELTYIDKEGKNQVIRSVAYKQNAEQTDNTLWSRIKNKKSNNDE